MLAMQRSIVVKRQAGKLHLCVGVLASWGGSLELGSWELELIIGRELGVEGAGGAGSWELELGVGSWSSTLAGSWELEVGAPPNSTGSWELE